MQESSAMEEDIDIYSDLQIDHEKSAEKCKNCSELEPLIVELTKQLDDLKKVNKNLEVNISSLLLTAKGEVARKDRMIADLRRQLDDAAFRRGKFRRHENYNGNFANHGSNAVTFEGDSVVYNLKEWPQQTTDLKTNVQPPLPENFRTAVPPPLPEDSKEYIPPPPPPEDDRIENINPPSPRTVYKFEYTCNSEQFSEEEDPEQKYEPHKIANTVFSQRLRKKLENEESHRKIFDRENAEKKFEEEKEREEEAERKEKERLQLVEETETYSKPVCENEKGSGSKRNLDNKENLSRPNQLSKNLELLVSQSKVSGSEEEFSLNRPVLVNKLLGKRTLQDHDEKIDIKHKKVEHFENYNDYREDWSVPEPEHIKINKESESYHLDDKKNNYEKSNEYKVEKSGKEHDREYSRHDLVSRLFQISTESAFSKQEKRRNLDRRRENLNLRSRDRDKYEKDRCERERYEKDRYEKERYEKDRYEKDRYEKNRYEKERYEKDRFEKEKYDKDRYEKEMYEKEKYREKYDREKFDRNKYKERTKNERHERDKYAHSRFEKGRFEKDKFEKNIYKKEENEREWFERNKLNQKRFERTQSLSPERLNSNRNRDLQSNEFKVNFEKRNQRNARFQSEEVRKKMENYKTKREIDLLKEAPSLWGRSITNEKDRRVTKSTKCCSNSRSRSSSSGKDFKTDTDKKISLESYRARKEQNLPKGNSSERSRSNSKDKDCKIKNCSLIVENQTARLEKELAKLDFIRRNVNKDVDCGRDLTDFTSSRPNRDIDNVKMDLEFEDFKLIDVLEKSLCEETLEEGEISNSPSSTPPLQIHENEEKKEPLLKKDSENLDTLENKIEELEKASLVETDKVENLKFVDQIRKNDKEKSSSVSKKESQVVDETKKTENPEEPSKTNKVGVIDDSVEKMKKVHANSTKKGSEKIDSVSEKKLPEISEIRDENYDANPISEDEPKKIFDSKILGLNSVVNIEITLEKHVQSLDSFIESAKKVLEENKEEHRTENKSVKVKENSEEKKTKKEIERETTLIGNKLEPKETESSSEKQKLRPIKERIKSERTEGNKREVVQEKKTHIQTESKEKEEKIEISRPLQEMKEILVLEKEKATFEKYKLKETEKVEKISKEEQEKKEISVPVKQKTKLILTESKEKEEKKDILSPMKEKKSNKQNESEEKEKEISKLIQEKEGISVSLKEKVKFKPKEFKEKEEEKEISRPTRDQEHFRNIVKEKKEISVSVREKTKHELAESNEEEEKEISIPVKEKTKLELTESNEKEKEKEISSPMKEYKSMKRIESKGKEEKKVISKPVHEKNEILVPEKEKVKFERYNSKGIGKEDKFLKEDKEKKALSSLFKEKKEILVSVKEKTKLELTESKEKDKNGEEKKIISSPVKERKKHKRNESNEREEGEILSPKKKKIKTLEKGNLKDPVPESRKELNASELKKNNDSAKLLSPVKDISVESKPKVSNVPSHILSTGRISRKPIKFLQDFEVPSKSRDEVKSKEPKKQLQKVSEAKTNTEKPPNRVVITIKRRKRPVVLSDCNASTTIVSNKNVIMNINLHKGNDKNLLS